MALDKAVGWDGPLQGLLFLAAVVSGVALLALLQNALFRAIVRRLTLRLAFSYFLIGIVPIPLLTLLLLATGYLLGFQVIAGRVKREVVAIAEEARAGAPGVLEAEVRDGKIARSPLSWLPQGESVSWKETPQPHFLLSNQEVWLAAPGSSPSSLRLLPFSDPSNHWAQRLADRTGFVIAVEGATEGHQRGGIEIRGDRERSEDSDPDPPDVRPRNRPATGSGLWNMENLLGIYMVRPVGAFNRPEGVENVVVFIARTSPRYFFEELFSTWIPGAGKVVLAIMTVIAASLLIVYLIALVIAFVLVGTIARNVNRMTRASQAIARGDFSVRVNSKSRDQIGDLARSFDGMAASIERLLLDTARKERLESEIAIARTIQQKLLPAPRETLPGFSVLAQFDSVAEIGGDYYDYFRMPDGRSAVAVGDVSGHGLPTGLLAAMAKAALSTLLESGVAGSPLFARLNELIYRSTDSRNYMTLSFLAYDPKSRLAELTNAGQLAPYHLKRKGVTTHALPSFPLGASPRSEFPTVSFSVEPGDLLLFFTDGYVEAANAAGEPWGFERLEAVLQREASSGEEALRDAVLAGVEKHSEGRAADDDRTMVILTFS
jgi:serine phosphatase RsbU (regulator of sigma subunit)